MAEHLNIIRTVLLVTCVMALTYVTNADAMGYIDYIWVSHKAGGGSLNYNGKSTDSITGSLLAVNTGSMSIDYRQCSILDVFHPYQRHIQYLFIGNNVRMGGKEYKLTVDQPTGGWRLSQYSSEYSALVLTSATVHSATEGRCADIGYTLSSNIQYPPIRVHLETNGLPVGHYEGVIPVRMAVVENYGKTPSDVRTLAESLVFDHTTLLSVPYSITISESCTFSATNLNINHGDIRTTNGDGNTASGQLGVNCTKDSSVVLSLTAVTTPHNKYNDGVGVGLGNGWDTSLTIVNTGINDTTPSKTVNLRTTDVLSFRSVLKKTANSVPGELNGSAILRAELQ